MITGAEDSTILPVSQTALAKKINKLPADYSLKQAGHAVIVQKPDLVNRQYPEFHFKS